MGLARQGRDGERGYAMAALLVTLSVMAVMMSVALPVWRTQVQREKEEELIFRGMQYARAVNLYQRKFGSAYPPSVEALVAGKFLRRKYKDPITGEDFLPLAGTLAAIQPGGAAPQPSQPGGVPPAAGGGARLPGAPAPGGPAPAGAAGQGGLIGVVSRSTAQSIRMYNGRTRYNEWAFVAQALTAQPGAQGGTPQPGLPPGTPSAPRRPGLSPGAGIPPAGAPGTPRPALPGLGMPFPGGPTSPRSSPGR